MVPVQLSLCKVTWCIYSGNKVILRNFDLNFFSYSIISIIGICIWILILIFCSSTGSNKISYRNGLLFLCQHCQCCNASKELFCS